MAHKRVSKSTLRKPAAKRKIGKVLGEAKRGTLRTSAGRKPTSRKQELAIALSEAEQAVKRGRKRKK